MANGPLDFHSNAVLLLGTNCKEIRRKKLQSSFFSLFFFTEKLGNDPGPVSIEMKVIVTDR